MLRETYGAAFAAAPTPSTNASAINTTDSIFIKPPLDEWIFCGTTSCRGANINGTVDSYHEQFQPVA
jgi:hypothetical protein